MIEFTPIHTTDKDYPFIENLLHTSFPENERRDDEGQRYNTDHNPLFTCYLITDGDTKVGLFTLWSLNGFHYAEHLATSLEVRNRGYGRLIMEKVTEMIPDTLVLEVEEPNDEMSIRRIGFYQRCGLRLCDKSYMQPPYRKGDQGLPLKLMFYGTENIDGHFDSIRDNIHKEVYGVTDNTKSQE